MFLHLVVMLPPFAFMEKIKLPDLSLEEVDMIVESLSVNYMKMLRKAQRWQGERSTKMVKEMSLCQTTLQEMTTIANYARDKAKVSDSDGSTLLHREET